MLIDFFLWISHVLRNFEIYLAAQSIIPLENQGINRHEEGAQQPLRNTARTFNEVDHLFGFEELRRPPSTTHRTLQQRSFRDERKTRR